MLTQLVILILLLNPLKISSEKNMSVLTKSTTFNKLNNSSTLSADLSNWMKFLPEELKLIPFIHLAIPGTHNSMTYAMDGNCPIAPDAYTWLKRLRFLGWPLRVIVSRWSITQTSDITAQLEHGIRYFDLRVTTKEMTDDLYFCHGLYSGKVKDGLIKMNEFLNKHSGEVIILDFQHFYGFTFEQHSKLLKIIQTTFKDRVFNFSHDIESFTLEYLTIKNTFQVICIYRSPEGFPFHWPSDSFPTPWPATTSVHQLFAVLNHGLNRRPYSKGYISQCVLTPDSTFVMKHPFSTLRNSCALRLHKPMMQWIDEQSPGKGKLNVTITDFADTNDWIYARKVIDLNSKLLQM